jgi:uncharacterized protein YndB with AHSA1/START domain
MNFDPSLDLVLERTVDISPALVWKAWTTPEHLEKWFTPAPWTAKNCVIDLRPGGAFRSVMVSPEGEEHPQSGCYLEVVHEKKLVWTDALEEGFRPAKSAPHLPFRFTATIELEAAGGGTRYRATVMHADAASRDQHAAMGFADGWGAALTQLVAHMKSAGR